MYTIKQISTNKLMVYLHEECEFDIHYVCRNIIEGKKAEYVVKDKYSAEIAFF